MELVAEWDAMAEDIFIGEIELRLFSLYFKEVLIWT